MQKRKHGRLQTGKDKKTKSETIRRIDLLLLYHVRFSNWLKIRATLNLTERRGKNKHESVHVVQSLGSYQRSFKAERERERRERERERDRVVGGTVAIARGNCLCAIEPLCNWIARCKWSSVSACDHLSRI